LSIRPRVRFSDPNIWNDFLAFVKDKYGTNYRYTGEELQNIIYKYLAENKWKNYSPDDQNSKGTNDQDHSTHTKYRPRKLSFMKAFFFEFKYDPHILNDVLIEYIEKELGISDNRAVNGWIRFLKSLGWITEVSYDDSTAWEINLPETKIRKMLGLVKG
jgi:hypothetical protein